MPEQSFLPNYFENRTIPVRAKKLGEPDQKFSWKSYSNSIKKLNRNIFKKFSAFFIVISRLNVSCQLPCYLK